MAKYIGKRIVPVHCGRWDQTKTYEMLSIVLEENSGDSYISRRAVPSGTAITDKNYWMLHSLYSQQIKDMSDQLSAAEARIKADNDATEAAIRQDNDATEAAIRQDNQTTREHVDSSLEQTTEELTETVKSARSAMTQQKASFDQTAAALNTRMDAVLAAGTGAGETEILDARVDKDGVTHDSLGAAVRHVGNSVDQVYLGLDNLYRQSTAQKGYIHANTGEPVGGTGKGEWTSDFIPIENISKFTVQVWATPAEGDYLWMAAGFYDADKNFIRRMTNQSEVGEDYCSYTFPVLENTVYIRVSARFFKDGRMCVNYGSVPITYRMAWDDAIAQNSEITSQVSSNHGDIIGGYYLGEWGVAEEEGTLIVTLPNDCKIRVGRKYFDVSGQIATRDNVTGAYFMYALFINDAGELSIKYYRDVLTADEHLVGYVYRSTKMIQTPLVDMAGLITSGSPCGLILGAYSPYYVQFDTQNKTITFPPDTLIVNSNTRYGNAYFFCPTTCDYSELDTTAIKIYYSILKQELIPRFYSVKPAKDDILICSFRTSSRGLSVSMNAPYFVDGKPMGLDLSKYIDIPEIPEIPKIPAPFSFIRAVNHRGWNWYAPENTLPAFIQSKEHGFEAAECDVHWTSDGVPVLLHDDTVNRTARNADGTELEEATNISSITFEEARALDFGIRNGEQYKGTLIPTFDEFIRLCKQIGLHPYIEIKSGCTAERAQGLVDIVKRYRMLRDCTWISFGATGLRYVSQADPQARLGLLASAISDSMITAALALKNDTNEVFVECDASNVDEDAVNRARNADLGLEVWGANSDQRILGLDLYISGMTSDGYVCGQVLYDLLVKK